MQSCVVLGSGNQPRQTEPFWKTPIGQNTQRRINFNDTFDAATGELIFSGFIYPPLSADARQFQTVFTIPDGAISFDGAYQSVMSANMTPISERTGFWYHLDHSSLPQKVSQPIVKLRGNVVFLHMNCHYWHFQHETITQILILRESGELARLLAKSTSTTLLVKGSLDCGSPNVHGSIYNYYGLDGLLNKMTVHKIDDKVIYKAVGGDLVLTGNDFYHPSLYFLQHTAELAAKSRQKQLQLGAAAAPSRPSRLYIDREATYKRGVVNQDELVAALTLFNFTVFSPASRTYTEQKEAFAGASLILSSSGTAFSANVIHCDPNNTILIEMFGKPIHTRTGADSWTVSSHICLFIAYLAVCLCLI